MKTVAVIPARMGSSRFPGKPLADLLGRTMIEHVYKRTALSPGLSGVVVATCDKEIADAVRGFGGTAVMTSGEHERASDRVAEASGAIDADVIVMVQGDEPMVHPHMIDEALQPIAADDRVVCVNLTKRIEDEAEFLNPNTIKVVFDGKWDALYMSRQPIPTAPSSDFAAIAAYKQVCIIPFRQSALERFSSLEPTALEIAESIDMMRFLQHGIKVRMTETRIATHAVDTVDDLNMVEDLMAEDPLLQCY